MLASYTWLKDYVDIKETPEELAEKLFATPQGGPGWVAPGFARWWEENHHTLS